MAKTVLFIERGGEVGGAERVLLDIVHGADAGRYRSVVACLDEGALPRQLREAGVPTRVFPVGRLRGAHRVVRALTGLARLVRAEGVDLVHANGTMMLLYAGPVAWAMRRPLVWHVYDPQGTTSWSRRAFVTMVSWFRPDWTVFGTVGVEENHRRVFAGIGRCSTILPGVDAPAFASARPDPAVLPSLPEGAVVALVLARLVHGKGLEHLVDAMGRLGTAHPELHVVVCGGLAADGYSAILSERAFQEGVADRLHFVGYVSEETKRTLVATCDFLIHPATVEPFGLSVVEAMAAGKPVVAGDAVGPSHTMRDDVTGILYPRNDVDALATAISRMASEPYQRRRMGEAGREWAVTFSVHRMVDAVQGVWAEVLAGREAKS